MPPDDSLSAVQQLATVSENASSQESELYLTMVDQLFRQIVAKYRQQFPDVPTHDTLVSHGVVACSQTAHQFIGSDVTALPDASEYLTRQGTTQAEVVARIDIDIEEAARTILRDVFDVELNYCFSSRTV